VLDPAAFEVLPLEICVLETYFGVENPLEGLEPGACWRPLPCSVIKAGASFGRRDRICGTSLLRATSLTAASLGNSE
jgi:hypothetical protein